MTTKRTDRELIELTKQLVSIESIAEKPTEIQKALDFVADLLKKSGKNIAIRYFESNGVPSLLAYRASHEGNKFDVILNGHVDVVTADPKLFKPVEKEGKLYGRGVHDMKAACVIMAETLCEFVDQPLDIALQIVCDEERGGPDGTAHQVSRGISADFVIAGECGRRLSLYEISHATKGTVFADVTFSGTTAHGAYPWRGDNAAMKAVRFVDAIHKLYPTPSAECQTTTVTVTGIVSHTGVHNRIPEDATVRLDARSVADDTDFESPEAFTAFVKRIDPGAEVNIAFFTTPGYTNPDNHYMQQLKKAAEAIEGHPFSFVRRNGGSDTRHYRENGIHACEFGVAGEQQHGENEHITIGAFKNYRKTLQTFLRDAANSTVQAAKPVMAGARK